MSTINIATNDVKLMNKAQLADLLGLKVGTVDKYVRAGKIPCMRLSQKIVRFHPGDVIAALQTLN